MTREEFLKEAHKDEEGVWRWNSNNHVPFDDMLESVGCSVADRCICQDARDADTAEFFRNYKPAPPSEEELFEMRSAFGEGETVVNVFTGEKIQL